MKDYQLRNPKNLNPVFNAMVNNTPEKPHKDPRKAEKEKFKIMLKNKLKTKSK